MAPLNVLFLCTGNTARSILAEAILRHDGDRRFSAFSAGSQPKGVVNPMAIKVLAKHGYPTAGLRSKNWREFAIAGAPVMHLILTVCDNAADEPCPIWPGHPATAHWGIADPAAVESPEAARREAFETAFRLMHQRIQALLALPLADLDPATLRTRLTEIGAQEGATRTNTPA